MELTDRGLAEESSRSRSSVRIGWQDLRARRRRCGHRRQHTIEQKASRVEGTGEENSGRSHSPAGGCITGGREGGVHGGGGGGGRRGRVGEGGERRRRRGRVGEASEWNPGE